MADEEFTETQIESDLFVSPLREVALEVHEIYEELDAVGFPRDMLAQIIAHIVSDTVLYRDIEVVEDDEEDEDEDGTSGAIDLDEPDN